MTRKKTTSARGCSPLRCMLFSQPEKTKTELGSQCCPGGRKREEEDGRTPCIIRPEERRDKRKTSGTRQIALLPFLRWALPTFCLFAGERKDEDVQGDSQGRRDTRMALLPLAPSHFAVSRGGMELACIDAHCPGKPGRLWLFTGESWRPQQRGLLPQQLLLSQHHGQRPAGQALWHLCIPLWLASHREAQAKFRSVRCQGAEARREKLKWKKGSGCCGSSSKGWSG